ncbi:MAG: metallophosphoesterase [Verrucomicrobiota bacterium]|nr:metallophosphoesterase [Limisphaera sp.]MDW8381366.1 metallophosphoesterase [Verrucomicrobiota bacterium]
MRPSELGSTTSKKSWHQTFVQNGVCNRRAWLRGCFGLTLSLLGACAGLRTAAQEVPVAKRRRALRLAHITDVHVQPELGAARGLVACLHHLQSLPDPPELIVNTGDSIMDAMAADADRTRLQWDLWRKILKAECSLPVEHAIGNHDCWGLNRKRSGTTGQEPLWGKRWALEALQLEAPYRTFERAGWHFIVLDSIDPWENSYRAYLGEEQLAWLRTELQKIPKIRPVVVLSHIPIVSAAGLLENARVSEDGNLTVGRALMHLDGPAIHALLRQHGNVRLCLSGHLHMLDRVEFDAITYITTGAVSSAWWRGVHKDRFDYGYAVVDLYNDGTFHYQYHRYGWQTVPEPAPQSGKSLETEGLVHLAPAGSHSDDFC